LRADELKSILIESGATVVGVGDISPALREEIMHLKRAVSIGVKRNLNADTVKQLIDLQKKAESYLRQKGYRFLSIPPDSDRRNGKFISRLYGLFCHKTAATCAGLGWIGKNGLLINREYGPRLSWATVLTDAPFEPDEPVVVSGCKDCDLCVKYCPSGAISGVEWSRSEPFPPLVDYKKCDEFKKARRRFEKKPNCGVCINICPYGRQRY
jgi:epoxyqueuosine reductase QueG